MFIVFLAAVAAATPPKPTIDPELWFGADSYPAEAINKGLEGSVGFEVDVDADGKPTGCRISQSSGQPILDQATCDAVLSKAHFEPAKGSDGNAIAGQYRNTTNWQISGPLTPGYSALILDFSKDPDRPTCVRQGVGTMRGATCAQLLEKLGPNLATLGKRWSRMIILTSTTEAGQQPYNDADWGVRMSYLATDQYFLGGRKPVACVNVAAEGIDAGQDGCARLGAAASSPDEKVKKDARMLRFEIAIYAVPRK